MARPLPLPKEMLLWIRRNLVLATPDGGLTLQQLLPELNDKGNSIAKTEDGRYFTPSPTLAPAELEQRILHVLRDPAVPKEGFAIQTRIAIEGGAGDGGDAKESFQPTSLLEALDYEYAQFHIKSDIARALGNLKTKKLVEEHAPKARGLYTYSLAESFSSRDAN